MVELAEAKGVAAPVMTAVYGALLPQEKAAEAAAKAAKSAPLPAPKIIAGAPIPVVAAIAAAGAVVGFSMAKMMSR